MVSGPSRLLVSSPVEIRGGHGGDGELSVLEVPSSYHRATGLAGQRDAAGYAVAHAYPVARPRVGRPVLAGWHRIFAVAGICGLARPRLLARLHPPGACPAVPRSRSMRAQADSSLIDIYR